jgi:hypothetical protein
MKNENVGNMYCTCMYFKISNGVTKICRLSWLTNSALVYEPKYLVIRGGVGGGGVVGSQPMSTAVHMEPQ